METLSYLTIGNHKTIEKDSLFKTEIEKIDTLIKTKNDKIDTL